MSHCEDTIYVRISGNDSSGALEDQHVDPRIRPGAAHTSDHRRRQQQIADAAQKSVAKLTLRVVGETVDVQAITRFWRQLEQSPFIENVNLVGSTTKPVAGADVIEFTLDLQFQRPDSTVIRTVPLNVQVR